MPPLIKALKTTEHNTEVKKSIRNGQNEGRQLNRNLSYHWCFTHIAQK